jgi:hypothetical protein
MQGHEQVVDSLGTQIPNVQRMSMMAELLNYGVDEESEELVTCTVPHVLSGKSQFLDCINSEGEIIFSKKTIKMYM